MPLLEGYISENLNKLYNLANDYFNSGNAELKRKRRNNFG
jgi:hypothetical protein